MSQREYCEMRVYNIYCSFCEKKCLYFDQQSIDDDGWFLFQELYFCSEHAPDPRDIVVQSETHITSSRTTYTHDVHKNI